MAIKIDKKIIGYALLDDGNEASDTAAADQKDSVGDPKAPAEKVLKAADIILMHESVARPELLLGSTYKVKTPGSEHAMYITINDIVLNEGTAHEQRRPFEIFINSKNMDHFQWIVALTRITSAVFRKGGDVTFLVEEMRAVFDPQGGYFKKGGKFMPSLVAEIGEVIEDHLKKIGMIIDEPMSAHQRAILDEKRAQYDGAQLNVPDSASEVSEDNQYPAAASLCRACLTKAVIILDGCNTCLSCGDSKCS